MAKASVREISRITGFSPATVSNALNRKRSVSEETAREALRLASHKLPCKTKIVSKADTENGGE